MKDPGLWAPLVIGLGVGLLLLVGLDAWMDRLRALARLDPAAAARGAEETLRWMGWGLSAFLLLLSALLARSCQLGLREGRFPPSGGLALVLAALAIATVPVFRHGS